MPPVARALTRTPTPELSARPPEIPAAFALREFISEALDNIVRSAFENKELPEKKHKKPSFDSVHDARVYALQSRERLIHGDENEIIQLAARTREWQRPLDILTTSPFRLCFRLEEPEEGGGNEVAAGIEVPESMWYVRYLLQP